MLATTKTMREIPTVEHRKKAGRGYSKWSPLYDKQEGSIPRVEEKTVKVAKPTETPESLVPTAQWRPVSTTMMCILNLCCQYFLIYSALAIVRGYYVVTDPGGGGQNSEALKTLEAASATVNYAPMLSVLFLASRMRAIQLTQGHTEKYMLPQPWVQLAMQACTWAVLMQVLIVLLLPCITGKATATDVDGHSEVSRLQGGCSMICTCLRYLIMACLYGGFLAVCIGVHMMKAPKEVYPEGTPPVSPAVNCVMILSTVYFIIYFLLAVFRTYNQVHGYVHTRSSDTFQLAAYTVNFAPMLCILFIATRLRALQMDPRDGNPQWWAQYCFYLCTISVICQTFLVVFVPFCFGGKARKGSCEGDITFEIRNACCSTILTSLRWLALIGLYGGFSAVIVSVIIIEHPKGPEYTPELSPTLLCIIGLTFMFFGVYLMLWMSITYNQIVRNREDAKNKANPENSEDRQPPKERKSSMFVQTLETARTTVMFCPMLAILFTGTRMRALQITGNRGAPPGWAQDCMYLSTCAVLAQLLMVILVGLCSKAPAAAADEGSDSARAGILNLKTSISEGLHLIFHLIMYGGAIAVVYAAITMTPETANGRGSSIPYVVDGKDSQFPEAFVVMRF